jgi:endonuclease YncB( thermonuclease family)
MVAKVFSPKGVDIGRRLVSRGSPTGGYPRDYVDAENEARKARRGMWWGHLRQALGVARIVTAAAPAGTFA